MRTRLKLAIAASVLAASTMVTPALNAEVSTDAAYVNWAAWLPAYVTEFDPGSADDCVAGRDKCAVKTLREMESQLTTLASSCSHNAVFSLAYTRISQGYAWIRTTGTATSPYYANTAGLNYIVEVFARTYLRWWNEWSAGKPVTTSWQLAFNAAKNKRVSGTGNLMLGINAHINRDLPFVVAAAGLVNTDGTSRKPDYDKVNDLLYELTKPLNREQAARLDPSMSTGPGSLADPATFNLIASWRERAWRNAESLTAARDATERALVAQRIEDEAAADAATILASTLYTPPLTSSASRDTHCAAHHADVSSAYQFSVAK